MRRILVIGLAIALSACSDNEADQAAEREKPELPEYAPKTPVDKALVEIPPTERRNFQKAFACEVSRYQGNAIEVTPEYITGLRDRLKANPSLAEC